MSAEPVHTVVAASLETWKRQLLDLTRRNRALNFRPLKVSTIAVVDEQPAEVFRLLYHQERALTFAAAPEEATAAPDTAAPAADGEVVTDDPFGGEEHLTTGEAFAPYASEDLTSTHTDTVLQTTLDPEALDRALRRIEEQARLSVEEQGVNTLFLALGLLHYTEAEASEEVFKAPLVLLPVTLRRQSARSPFVLALGEDEPMVNPALAELLRRQFDVALPELPTDEGTSLQGLFVGVQEALRDIPAARATRPWTITNDIYLGLFSFQKLVMYKDLEANAAAVVGHRLVTQLITRRGTVTGGGLGLPDDVREARLDDEYPPERGAHVVDADGSQQRALAAADRGYDLVVEGPPGTGKSQTITNLVAQALHAGKSVLFVAEKMAALDVVHQRLHAAGLGEFCLELHSTRASKREVIRSIAAALDASLAPAPSAPGVGDKLRDVRATLGEYVTALHAPFGALQVSPYAAYGELARVLDAPRVDWTIDPEQVTRPELDAASSRLEALAAASTAAGDVATHPWRDTGRTFYPQDQLDAICEIATSVQHAVAQVQAASESARGALGTPFVEVLADVERVRAVADVLQRAPGLPREVLDRTEWDAARRTSAALVEQVAEAQRLEAEVRQRFTDAVDREDLDADIAYVEAKAGVMSSLFWWLDGRQRAIRARWRAWRTPGYTASFAQQAHDLMQVVALRAARSAIAARDAEARAVFGAHWRGTGSDVAHLTACLQWVDDFRRVREREALPESTSALAAAGTPDLTTVVPLEEAARECAALVQRLSALVQWRADAPGLETLRLADVQARAAGLVAHASRAARWGAFVAAEHEVRDGIAAPLLEAVGGGRVSHTDLPRAFLRAFWFAWLARAVEGRPALARFQALTHEQRVAEFRALDRAVLEDNRARLVASLRARVQTRLREPQVDAAMPVLRREMAKQRNHRPIRETLRQADAAVRAIKPVFLMSPLSVAQFTGGSAPGFDLVVFDEASQLPPEDAVGSIVRGRQLVVVGDPKQLPPTSFFATQRDVHVAAEGDDGLEVPDAESILEAFMGCGVPMSRLKWHYRSAHESLISFSNVSFYDGDLLTFPSVEPISAHLGLRFEYVSDGVYEGKGLNLAEARRVADAVVAFAHAQLAAELAGRRPQSLGVGTFNLRQQLAIQDLLEARRRDEPAIEAFFDRSRHEPFFVKNLENIQGDERDAIFLSVTYAKGRDGRLRQNFGPLNGDNGWRRLNVLTTRARRAMRVFSSMRASDIHEGQSKGGPLLKAFLEYAESGRLDHPAVKAAGGADSPFEREVVNDLTRRGYLVEAQVGVAGYRIDIGVRDPQSPGRFLLGIECDGVAYHASDTARDRDRLRQQVLETRGWRIVRLWSTDWFKDRQGQMERLERAIADAQAAGAAREPEPLQTTSAPGERPDERLDGQPLTGAAGARALPAVDRDGISGERAPAPEHPRPAGAAALASGAAPEHADGSSAPYVKAAPPKMLPGDGVLDCPMATLAAIVRDVVRVESPVHEDEVVTRVAAFWGQRAGARIRARVMEAAREVARTGGIEVRGEFLWVPDGACPVRDRADTGIGAERIAPEEYEAAVRSVLVGRSGVRRDALLAEVRTRLGFERTGSTLSAAIAAAIDRLVATGRIGEGSGGYRWR